MAKGEQTCGPYPVVYCKFAIGFISLAYHIVIHQIDIISRHFAVAFNIPTHNIGIYFNKLYSLRCLTFVISGFIENCIFQAAGGDNNTKRSMKVRRYFAVTAFTIFLTVRCVYLFLLYTSSNLSYHIYVILVVEGFCFGLHDPGFMTLASEYMSLVTLFYNVCRLFVSGCQLLLDRVWYDNPLLMIKIQTWIAVILTAIGVGLWFHYNLYIKVDPGPTPEQSVKIMEEPGTSALDILFEKLFEQLYTKLNRKREDAKRLAKQLENKLKDYQSSEKPEDEKEQIVKTAFEQYCADNLGNDGIGAALSPIFLYWASTMFKDFLFPATLPYGLLQRDKCHIINLLIPIFINLGPFTFFVMDNFTDVFGCWSWYLDLFWILFIPMPIILRYVLLAVFTRRPAARVIINSQPRVISMTLMMMVSFGYMETLSYNGLAKYAFRRNPGGYTIMGFQLNSGFFCRSLFSKISVGFSDTRISLGYHLPKFRPNHRMSKRNLAWYFIRNTFRTAWRDTGRDLKMDIRDYL